LPSTAGRDTSQHLLSTHLLDVRRGAVVARTARGSASRAPAGKAARSHP
jgi:hypothetical protein